VQGFGQRPRANDALHRFSYRPPFDSFLVEFALEDALHVDAGRVNHFWVQVTHFDQVLDFRNRDFGGGAIMGLKFLAVLR